MRGLDPDRVEPGVRRTPYELLASHRFYTQLLFDLIRST